MSSPSVPGISEDDIDDRWRDLLLALQSIKHITRTATDYQQFYPQLMDRAVSSLRLSGGVVWQRLTNGSVQATYQQRPDLLDLVEGRESQRFHLAMVELTGRGRQALQVGPQSTVQGIANPTHCTLMFAPVVVGDASEFILEFFSQDSLESEVVSGLASMIEAVAAEATEFHRLEQTRRLGAEIAGLEQFQRFAVRVHSQLDLTTTAMTIVNEALTVLRCDRACLLQLQNRRARMLAVSGTDGFDRRSDVVRRLELLASHVAVLGEVEFPSATELPAEVERPLAAYIDALHAESLTLLPLYRVLEPHADQTESPGECIGVLSLERFTASPDHVAQNVVSLYTKHASVALDNALLTHRWLWLRVTSAWLGEQVVRRRGPAWRRWAAAGTIVIIGLMGLLPVEFRVDVKGHLQPRQRQDVFAPVAAIVADVHVNEKEKVSAGAKLLTLRSPALELQINENLGKRQATEAALASARALRLQTNATEAERARAAAEEEELKATLNGISTQYAILAQQQTELEVRTSQAGEVITRDVRRRLLGRPVKPGDLLLQVANVSGDWQLELELPEDRLQSIRAAQATSKSALPVRYLIASAPRESYEATLEDVSDTAQIGIDQKPIVPMKAAISGATPEAAQPQATVYAQIQCGRRPLAYVWLYDVWQAAKLYWWQ